MGRKETEKAVADSRAGRVTRVGSVSERLAEMNAGETPENLDNWLQEKAGPARTVSAGRVRYTLAELLAETEKSGQYPLLPEEREWSDAPAVSRELLPEDL